MLKLGILTVRLALALQRRSLGAEDWTRLRIGTTTVGRCTRLKRPDPGTLNGAEPLLDTSDLCCEAICHLGFRVQTTAWFPKQENSL